MNQLSYISLSTIYNSSSACLIPASGKSFPSQIQEQNVPSDEENVDLPEGADEDDLPLSDEDGDEDCQSEMEDGLPPLQDETQRFEGNENIEETPNPEEDENNHQEEIQEEHKHEEKESEQESEEKESEQEPEANDQQEDEPEGKLVPAVPKTPNEMELIEVDDSPEHSGTNELEAQERFASQRESIEEQIMEVSAKLNTFKKMAASKFLSAKDSTFFCFLFGHVQLILFYGRFSNTKSIQVISI